MSSRAQLVKSGRNARIFPVQQKNLRNFVNRSISFITQIDLGLRPYSCYMEIYCSTPYGLGLPTKLN